MLVLKRLPGQQIIIDGQIRVTVLKISGSRVSLGLDAPASTAIVRAELLEPSPTSTLQEAPASSDQQSPRLVAPAPSAQP